MYKKLIPTILIATCTCLFTAKIQEEKHNKVATSQGAHASQQNKVNQQKATCVYILKGHRGKINSLAYSKNGKTLISCDAKHVANVWKRPNFSFLRTFEQATFSMNYAALSSNNKFLASINFRTITIKTHPSKKKLRKIKVDTSALCSLCYAPNSKILASGSEDGTVIIWNAGNGQRKYTIEGLNMPVISICYAPDGKAMASIHGKSVKIWNTTNYACVAILREHHSNVSSICFAPDGKTLASGTCDGTIKIWQRSNI